MQHLLKLLGLILGGDLNFTLFGREVWGLSTQQHHLVNYFTPKFKATQLVDIEPLALRPR